MGFRFLFWWALIGVNHFFCALGGHSSQFEFWWPEHYISRRWHTQWRRSLGRWVVIYPSIVSLTRANIVRYLGYTCGRYKCIYGCVLGHIQENLEDELVQEALRKGLDLRQYSREIESELRKVELRSVQDCILEICSVDSEICLVVFAVLIVRYWKCLDMLSNKSIT